MLCEQLGQEPDPNKMPLETSVFPHEVQVAFFIFELLPDKWDGMSGYYLGKDWSSTSLLFEIYDIENRREVLYFAKLYENLIVNFKAEEAARKQKQAERARNSNAGITRR